MAGRNQHTSKEHLLYWWRLEYHHMDVNLHGVHRYIMKGWVTSWSWHGVENLKKYIISYIWLYLSRTTMIATDIRSLAHVYASCIPFRKHIWLKTLNFNPLTWPLTYTINLKGHDKIFIWLGILITNERDIKIQFLAHFDWKLRVIVFLQSTIVMDERPCWISHLIWHQNIK